MLISRRCEFHNTEVIHSMKRSLCMSNTSIESKAHSPQIRGARRGWGRAVCLGLVVLAGTFASAGWAESYRSLDLAVIELTEKLLQNGRLVGADNPPVLASSDYFFESETGFRMPLSGVLSAKFGTAFGGRGVRMVREGIDDSKVRILHARWRRLPEESFYLRLFVTEATERGGLHELVSTDAEVAIDERTRVDLEPTLKHSGRYLVQQLDRNARDQSRRTVYLRPLSVSGLAQPEEMRRELMDWLRNALIESRLFELAEPVASGPATPVEVDGELLGEARVGREDIQVDLRIRDNQPHQVVVTTASVKLPRKLIRNEDPCAMHFGENRLPEAAECFMRVRERDPGNMQALAWLTRIEERYVERVEEAIRRGRFDEAEGYVSQLRELNRENSRLTELEGKIARRAMRDCDECPEVVVVPSGRFMMGSPSDEDGRSGDEEGPVHEVTIAEPFAVGRYEVMFDEWEACRLATECSHGPDDHGWGRGNRPVIDVSWEDAQEYVRWLSKRTGHEYRLLSESEWEYVARARTGGPFHFGSTISTRQANYDGTYSYGSGREGEYREQTIPVGAFAAPNEFGLHEVHGNVWEWVEDCWQESYTEAPVDGSAWTGGEGCEQRVMRGGSWYDRPKYLRSAFRGWNTPQSRHKDVGFRIARDLTP